MPPFFEIFTLRANIPFPNGLATIVQGGAPPATELLPYQYDGTPYAMKYNLTVEREMLPNTIVTIGYTGSQARKLVTRSNLNLKVPVILPDGRQFFPPDAPRRNPNFSNVHTTRTNGNSNYNGLLVSVQKRFSKGYQLQGSYTFSKVLSFQETIQGSEFANGQAQLMDPYNPKVDYAPAEFDVRNNFVFNYTYDLPFPSNVAGAVGKLLGGWQVGGITKIMSGSPFSALSQFGSGNGSVGSSLQERPNLVPGRSNSPILGGPDKYFDGTAFELGPAGFYGNLGRNTLTDPGLMNWDFTLVKNTPITEKFHTQFRAEFFNIFNRANFATPAFVVFNSRGERLGSAGRITETVTTARQIQIGLKLIF